MAIPVFFGREKFEAPSAAMTGAELRRLFNVPADDDLFRARGPKVEGPAISDTAQVDLKAGDHFLSMPRNITGGDESATALHPRIRREVERLDALFEGCEVRRDPSGLTALVVTIPAHGWTPDPLRVMARVPLQYPDERPDLLFLQQSAQPPAGRAIPNLMGHTSLVGEEWTQISWHFGGPYDPNADNLVGFIASSQRYLAGAAQ